jgi:hypothetical protein
VSSFCVLFSSFYKPTNHNLPSNPYSQLTKTSAYIQIVGFIDNTAIGLNALDEGGELDPYGADLRSNPLGGVVYSNGISDSTNGTLAQVHTWNLSVFSSLL